LTPLLKKPDAEWPHPCLYEHVGHHFGDDVAKVLKDDPKGAIYQKVPWYVAVVQGGWKYVRYLQPGVGEELYDLGSDPEELKNLTDEKKHAKRRGGRGEAMAAEMKRPDPPVEMTPPKGKE